MLRYAGLDERDVRRVRLEERPARRGGPRRLVRDRARWRAVQRQRPRREEVGDAAPRGGRAGRPRRPRRRGGLPVPRRLLRHRHARHVRRRPRGPDVRRADRRRQHRAHRGGGEDSLLGSLPPKFEAFLGHKEAVSRLPHGAVLLASSAACPVQAFRLGRNVYATQFHPELDVEALLERIEVYRHHGYFDPAELAEVLLPGPDRRRHRAAEAARGGSSSSTPAERCDPHRVRGGIRRGAKLLHQRDFPSTQLPDPTR